MMDLEDWKVKLSKEREILHEVTKVVELERKRRTYIYELHDNIAEYKRKQTVKMKNMERSFRSSDTFQECLPSSTQERQPSPSSPLPSPTSCEKKLAKQMEKMNVDQMNTQHKYI